MDLVAWLKTLNADPFDDTAPLLNVYQRVPTDEEIRAAQGHPFVRVGGLPENSIIIMDPLTAISTRLVDVLIWQEPDDFARPRLNEDGEPIQALNLWLAVKQAPKFVTAGAYGDLFRGLRYSSSERPHVPDTRNHIEGRVSFRLILHNP